MVENGEAKHSESEFKTFLSQNKFVHMQKFGSPQLSDAKNSSSSIQTAISAEDKELVSRKDLKEKDFNNVQGTMQCCSIIYICISIIMIAVGGVNVRECPVDGYLPIWMIIYGCVGILVTLIFIYFKFPAFWCFLLIVSFVGAARLYPIYTTVQHSNKEALFYCPQLVYLLSFIIVTFDIVISSVALLSISAFCACSIVTNLMKNKANVKLNSFSNIYLTKQFV